MQSETNRRLLAVDDQESILEDFRKIFGVDEESDALRATRSAFFGEAPKESATPRFSLTTASQGEEGVQLVREAAAESAPFAMAFVDVRMPPGMDGIQTIKALWEIDPDLQVVICTAYSDYSFEDIITELGSTDRLLILKKPFDPVEVRQLASALVEKWNASERVRRQVNELEDANRRAEAASRAKSEFLANMSHEIRTPMNALLGYVELLCDPDVTVEEQLRYSEILKRSGDHLLTILNDILDISRIEASRLVVNKTDFSPAQLTREVAALLSTQAAEKDVDLRVEFDGPIPKVIESDHVRVRQVLLNLVGNAVKFTEQGSVRVVVHLDRFEDVHQRYLCFDVIDTGPGIDAKDLEHLFESFSQLDGSSTRRAGGTGLGLAISKRLAHLLGGDIEVESTPGKGSRFTLSLHVGEIRKAALVDMSAEDFGLAAEPAEVDLSDMDAAKVSGRILLVEDVRFNQLLMSAILRKAGAEVDVAENGREGIERLEEAVREGRPFDLVLMDMQMPVMDGYEATKHLRARGFALPIVALTAHAMAGDRERCLEAGCTDYATKPVDRARLLQLCRSILRDAQTPPALPKGLRGGDRILEP